MFSGAIATDTSGLEEGATVKIAAADGSLLGIGHYQIGSIAVRLLAMGREAASLAETGFDESFTSTGLPRLSVSASRSD